MKRKRKRKELSVTEAHAVQLACRLTVCEVIFMRRLTLRGMKFDFQVPIGGYVADFVFPDKMLIIEIDGKSHRQQVAYDDQRDKFLAEAGFTVWRIENKAIEHWKIIRIVNHVAEQGPRTYLQALEWARSVWRPKVPRRQPALKSIPATELPSVIAKYLGRT